jgi:hypothetical protein
MSNTNTAVVSASMPSTFVTRTNKNGKTLGTSYYIGTMSAKELKESLKLQGYKGSELKDKVNESLKNEQSQRRVVLAGTIAALEEKGFTGMQVDVNKAGDSAKIIMVKVKETKKPTVAGVSDMFSKLTPEQQALFIAEASKLSAAQIAASATTVNV